MISFAKTCHSGLRPILGVLDFPPYPRPDYQNPMPGPSAVVQVRTTATSCCKDWYAFDTVSSPACRERKTATAAKPTLRRVQVTAMGGRNGMFDGRQVNRSSYGGCDD